MLLRNNFNAKAFVFSLEALIALLLFGLILFSLPLQKPLSLKEVLVVQQQDDLLRVWSYDFPFESEMVTDAKKLFDCFDLFVDSKKVFACSATTNNSVASEGILLDNLLLQHTIRIVSYFP